MVKVSMIRIVVLLFKSSLVKNLLFNLKLQKMCFQDLFVSFWHKYLINLIRDYSSFKRNFQH